MNSKRVVHGALLGACLSGCATAAYEDHGVVFEQHELDTGPARSQTILPGFLLGGALADLAVVSVGKRFDRHLRLYAFEGGAFVPRLDVPLSRRVLLVDVAEIGGRDRLLTYANGRVSGIDPDTGTEEVLVTFAASTQPADVGQVPHVDITRDLNHDGRDDLVLPDVDGFWIALQASDGSFAAAVKLGPPEPFLDEIALEDTRTYGEVGVTTMNIPWYLSRVHEADYDRDGLSDLLFWNEDHFDVHLQVPDGTFDREPVPFSVGVPFDSDGIYTHIFGYSDESMFALITGFRSRSKRTALHSLRDMNGDDVTDLVTHSVEGRSLLRLSTSLGVHFGTPTPGGIEFASEPSTAIPAGGRTAAGYQTHVFQDLDGDGRIEIGHGQVETGIVQMVRALVGSSIKLDLDVYRIEDGVYPAEPSVTRRIRPDLHVFDRRGPFFPTVLTGDVNGDGLSDLLVGQSWEELRIFVGVPGPELFAEHPQRVEVALTANERDARMVDLNRDGKEDLLVHYPSGKEPHRLTLLISR